jgi:Ca-activated chloride channel family protein
MNRIAVAVVATLVVAGSNILADDNTPAQQPKPAPAATDKQKPPSQDPGQQKLTRRERKERTKNLPDQYRDFLRDVEPIMTHSELDTFLLLETDPQREIYITEFWRRRDIAQGTTNDTFKKMYYDRLADVKEQFKQISSDRARIYLIHGQPNEIVPVDCDRKLVPIQVWKYAYLPAMGHDVYFLFYLPKTWNDWRLWDAMADATTAMSQLLSEEAMATGGTAEGAIGAVFAAQAAPGVPLIEMECTNGEELMRALGYTQQNKFQMMKIFEPPQINTEDVQKILRSMVIADPNAPKLSADVSVHFPAKQGSRTDAELTILVPRAEATVKDVGGTANYSFDVTGEVLRDGKLFENYRYRFDFPGDSKEEKLPLIIDRFLRPNDYNVRLKIMDVHSGAQAIVEKAITVPELFDSPEVQRQKESASGAVSALKDAIESDQTQLRIVPLADDLLSGLQHIETIAVGDDIKAVEFYLDGRKVMTKRRPPYTLDLDFGQVPQVRKVRAIALDAKGQPITGDEIILNTGTDPFRVRIVSPRVAIRLKGKTRVEMSVNVPDGKKLDNLQLYLNETRVATLYDPPFVQSVDIPQTEGVGYLRAVATLKDDPTPPVEDVVMVNTPQYMEEVNVHLIELPTTVIVNGRPTNTLPETSFKVFDEGKPVKLARFDQVKNLPLSIGMAVDTSGSMQPRIGEAQKAGALFFKNVLKPGDKAFLASFDTQPQIVQKWSSKLADVNAGLSKLRAEESTALYDAVVYSLYNFLGVKGQKALVLITDGEDTSSKFTFDQSIEYARRAAVPIYAIGLGIRGTQVDVRYKLGKFCAETGGNVYYIDRADELGKIYSDIQNELRSQYVLGFYPPEGVKPGSKWREVSVQVSEGRAKTIRGYYP